MTNLRGLHVDDNQLTTLPDTIGNLTKLQYLVLENNPLTTLPDTIGNLTNLRELNVVNNKLTTLPDTIGNLTKLQYLVLENNPLTNLPDAIRNTLIDLQHRTNLAIFYEGSEPLPPSTPVPVAVPPSTPVELPSGLSHEQMKQNVLEINQYVESFSKKIMNSDTIIDINTTVSLKDPITLEEFNGTIKEYIYEDINHIVFAAKENNGSMLYFLTNRENIQTVMNEPINILYPCIKTGTMRSENIEKNVKLLNLRSLGFHTSWQYCFMNVYEKLPRQLQVFVIEDTGLNYPSYVSDDILNQDGNVVGGLHCQEGYQQPIAMLKIPEIIDSTQQQGGDKNSKTKKNNENIFNRMKKEKKIINYNKKIRNYLLKKNKLNHLEKYVDTSVPVIIRNNINKKYSEVKILVLQYLTTKI